MGRVSNSQPLLLYKIKPVVTIAPEHSLVGLVDPLHGDGHHRWRRVRFGAYAHQAQGTVALEGADVRGQAEGG